MPHILQNEHLKLHIDLPHENYLFSRFDWTGKITSVSYKGISITGNELKTSVSHPKTGRGFYNEFGIEQAVSYDDIQQGEWFHKIGIGLLQKRELVYDFLKDYKVKPAHFDIDSNSTENGNSTKHFTIKCKSALCNGYAYTLEKQIKLTKSGFVINYSLKNTGYKPIITKEYNHNFLCINQQDIGKNYKLTFDFKIEPKLFNKIENPNNVVTIGTNDFKFKSIPQSDFFFGGISGGKMVNVKWTLEDANTKIGITEENSFKVNTINLWGCGHVISPELFFDIHLKPDENITWSRRYSIFELAN